LAQTSRNLATLAPGRYYYHGRVAGPSPTICLAEPLKIKHRRRLGPGCNLALCRRKSQAWRTRHRLQPL